MKVNKIRHDLKRELSVGDQILLCDNVTIVTRHLSCYDEKKISRMCYVLERACKKGAGKMAAQLLLQGMKPVSIRDSIKQQLAREDDNSDSPSNFMAVM